MSLRMLGFVMGCVACRPTDRPVGPSKSVGLDSASPTTAPVPDGPMTDTSTDSSTDSADDSSTPEPEPEAFELWVETGFTDPYLLVMDTNLPADTGDCLAVDARGVPCADDDLDGLTDAWEQLLLERFRPVVRLDEDEPLMDDTDAVLVQLARVVSVSPGELFVPIILAWSKDYGRCGVTAHHGDSERVAVQVLQLSATSAGIRAVYTAAHEGEVTDQSTVWRDETLSELERTTDGALHWVVYASEGKHASYGTAEACEAASVVPCIEEDCAPDGVSDPAPFDRLPAIWNMGEPDRPLFTDLTELGLPGEDPWADQRFCGGLDRDDACSSPLREKLIEDPF